MNGDRPHYGSGQEPQASRGPGMLRGAGTPGPVKLTTGRWRNRRRVLKARHDGDPTEKWSKVLAHSGHGVYGRFDEGRDHEATTTRKDTDGPAQRCILGVYGMTPLDVDYEPDFMTTRTSRFVTVAHAISIRPSPGPGRRFHVLIWFGPDVPPEERPNGSSIHGADVRVNNFVPWPGSWHHSGVKYEPVHHPGTPPGCLYIVRGTREMAAAMRADQADYAAANPGGNGGGQGQGSQGNGGPVLPPTEVLLKHGAPHPHDYMMYRLACRLASQGRGEAEAYVIWRAVADLTQDPDDPFEYEADFLDQWQRAVEQFGSPPLEPEAAQRALDALSAGSGVCPPIDSATTLDKPGDQHVPYELEPPAPVRTLAQLRAKIKAETKHRHPLSHDNDTAPSGWATAYARMADAARTNAIRWSMGPATCEWEEYARLAGFVSEAARKPARGFIFHRDQVKGLDAHIAWSVHGNGTPLLKEMPDGWLCFLDDPKTKYHRWECGCFYKKHSSENYPNVEPGTCPVAKGDSALDLDALVKMVRAQEWGGSLSHYQVAAVINHPLFRRTFGLVKCRYASKDSCAKAVKRARDAEEMVRDKDAVLFRRGRHWLTAEPAHYTVTATYEEKLMARVGALIEQILPDVVKKLKADGPARRGGSRGEQAQYPVWQGNAPPGARIAA
jgi:hypothetical protein